MSIFRNWVFYYCVIHALPVESRKLEDVRNDD